MTTIIQGLRQIVGVPDFYDVATGAVDYAGMMEYTLAGLVLLVVVASVFRILTRAYG